MLFLFQFATRFCKRITGNGYIKNSLQNRKKTNVAHVYNMMAQNQKKKLKQRSTHFNASLKVVGSGAPGTPASVYFISDHTTYLFNCGEGTQRLSQEHHCKLSKIDNIFVTHLSWKNVGGLPGLLLTARDNGLTAVNIHSPEGIDSFIETAKSFVYFTNLDISYPCVNVDKIYQDDIMKVYYVPVTKCMTNIERNSLSLTESGQYHTNINGKRVVKKIEENETIMAEKRIKLNPNVICYICEIVPKRGKLLLEKCIELGVPPGPTFKLLKSGLDITTNDGKRIQTKDVCEPDGPKTIFIVAECPSEEYLNSFVNHPLFAKYEQQNEVRCIFHFTPEEIFNSKEYQKWLNKFSSKTEHVILNDKNTCMGSEAVHKNQYLLNMLHPEIFPLLHKDCFNKDEETKRSNIYRARTSLSITVRPNPQSLTTCNLHQSAETYINAVFKLPTFSDYLNELKANIAKISLEHNLSNISDYPRILMLGTGCSVPNKVRNTSGILLQINKDNSILLDCGEGTLGQIIRFFGVSESKNILRSIKAIFISHIHADHQLGLIGLLLKRKKLTNETLYLLIPKSMIPWLNFYNDRFEPIAKQYTIIKNSELYLNYHNLPLSIESALYNTLNVKEINTIYVKHCFQSYGIAVTLKDNKKIVYSGDTMFSQNLIQLGQECDLLIHEATMEDGLEELAKRKLHSTTCEAINAGKFMNAKFTLLTHFSQRYSKIPSLPISEANVGLAYDHMEIKLPQLPLLPLFYPCLKVMFDEYNKVMMQ